MAIGAAMFLLAILTPNNFGLTHYVAHAEAPFRGQVKIDGAVDGNVQLDAETIEILERVTGGVTAHGVNVHLGPKSAVAGTVRLWADRVVADGHIADAEIEAKAVMLNGRIDGAVRVAAETLTLGPQMRLKGSLTYVSPNPVVIDDKAELSGPIIRVENLNAPADDMSGGIGWVSKFIPLMGLIAAYIVWRQPNLLAGARQAFEIAIGQSMAEGLGALVVPPLAIVALTVTIFGMPFAIALAAFYAILLIGACIAAIVILGDWMMLSFGRPHRGVLRGRLFAVACGTAFLWLMTEMLGLVAWVVTASLGLGVIAAFADRFLGRKPTI
jgi:cytoskeletal protein CcmA (bactofilin family)